MAADPNRQTLMQQLSEMRATRMQQMRSGGQQSQLMGRQVQLTQSMNAALQNNTRQLGTLNTTMSTGFRNLSSSFTRSVAGLSSAIGKGAMGAAGGAAAGVGRVSASAVSGIASGVVSSLSMVLPAALAGLVGKALIWDNIEDGTKKELQENFTGVVKNALGGDAFKDITKEIKVLTLTMGDMLDSIGNKISGMAKALGVKAGPALKNATEKGKQVAGKAGELRSATSSEMEFYGKVGERVVGNLGPVDLPDVGLKEVAVGTAGVGAAKLAYDSAKGKPGKPGKSGAEPRPKMDESITKRFEAAKERKNKRREFVKANKLAGSKIDLLSGGVFGRIAKAGGKFAANFLTEFNKVKGGKVLWVLGVAMEVGMSEVVHAEVDQMLEDEEITSKEAAALHKWVTAQMWGSLIGASVLGTLAGIGAGAIAVASGGTGSVLVPAAVIGASAVGSGIGQETATKFVDLPKSLTEPVAGVAPTGASSSMANRRKKNRQEQAQGSATPKPASYAEQVAQGESGEAGYDAVFGSSTKKQVEEYKKTTGKKVSEMTIEEAIKFGKSRGANRGALGKYQFMPTTLTEALLKSAGLKMTDMFNPENQDKIFAAYNKMNAAALKQLGIEPNATNMHLAHILGPKGAAKVLSADPSANAGDVLGYKQESAARKTNPWMNKSAGEVVALFGARAGGGPVDLPEPDADAAVASAGGVAPTGVSGGDVAQGSAVAKPTEGMTVSQKADYYRKKLTEEEGGGAPKPGESPEGAATGKEPGKFGGFASMISGGGFESMKQQLLAGLDSDMERKAEGQTAGPSINYTGGDTNVNSNSGGGGGGAPAYNPVAPAASYQSQFTSIAGIQRTA